MLINTFGVMSNRMPTLKTYVDWNTYRRVMQRCALLTKKEGKKVTLYEFLKRAVLKALNDGL